MIYHDQQHKSVIAFFLHRNMYVTINKNFLNVLVYSYRVPQPFLPFLVPQLQVLFSNGLYPEHSISIVRLLRIPLHFVG